MTKPAYRLGITLLGNDKSRPSVGGCDIVKVMKTVQNGSRAVMLRAIHDFALKLKGAGPDTVGFLYYSGHGIASAGENYLIPIDVKEPSSVELNIQGVKHSDALAILRGEAPNAAHYLVLDAATRLLMPPIFVRTSPDSRHEGVRLDDLRLCHVWTAPAVQEESDMPGAGAVHHINSCREQMQQSATTERASPSNSNNFMACMSTAAPILP